VGEPRDLTSSFKPEVFKLWKPETLESLRNKLRSVYHRENESFLARHKQACIVSTPKIDVLRTYAEIR
jgi:hypothetical protein